MLPTVNMAEGPPLRHIARFALPLLLTNIAQVLYTLVDSVVVGRLLGVEAFAAVGASWFGYWLLLSTILGITQGFGTLFAQRFGAGHLPGLRRAFAMSILLSAALGAFFSAGGALLSGPALRWLHTPADILPDASTYLRVLVGGIWLAFLYNTLCSMLRGMGDSKTPLYAALLASLLNIALDFALVLAIPMGVRGVALATLLAQAAACLFCAMKLRRAEAARMTRADFAPDTACVKALLRLGLPLGFRNCVIAAGGLVVQYVTNGFGTVFVAGVSAARRLSDLLWMVASAIDGAIATFVAQNFGAKQLSRVRGGVAIGRRVLLVAAGAIMAPALLFGRPLLSLFLSAEPGQAEEALGVAYRQLCVTACGLPVLHMLFLYRSSLQGLGDTLMPMLSGFLELGLRVACVLALPLAAGAWGVYLADAAGWAAAAPQLYIAYRAVYKKRLAEG